MKEKYKKNEENKKVGRKNAKMRKKRNKANRKTCLRKRNLEEGRKRMQDGENKEWSKVTKKKIMKEKEKECEDMIIKYTFKKLKNIKKERRQ